MMATILFLTATLLAPSTIFSEAQRTDYYYTRTRQNPNHLRISEEFKNKYINDVKFESKINGTKYEYYKSSLKFDHDELVFETIDKIFRHRLSAFYIHHYDSEKDKRSSFDAKLVSNEACSRDLMYLVDKIQTKIIAKQENEHLTPELSAFFDSYARQEAGLLMGNTYWVGAYEQCINRHIFELDDRAPFTIQDESLQVDNPESNKFTEQRIRDSQLPVERLDQQVVDFKGRYCVSSLKSKQWQKKIDKRKIEQRNYFRTQKQIEDYSKLFRLQVGICLPSSCDSTSLHRHIEEIKLLTTAQLESRYRDYELIDLYCLPDETSPLRLWSGSALYFVVFMSVWFSTIFLATLADLFEFVDTNKEKPSDKLEKFVTWFSLIANYHKLMKVSINEDGDGGGKEKRKPEQDKNKTKDKQEAAIANGKREEAASKDDGNPKIRVNLRFLNAFKVLIMFWIVNGHIMLLMIQTAKNILYSDALLNGLMHFLIGATFGVDLFFTMTGFLTSYLIFNSGHAYKMKPTSWIYLTFHRYWRLAPMYLLTFWFSKSVMQLLGSGPLWDYGTSGLTFRGLCNQESWWYPLTLTSNLHGLFEECMITSWYISCDMQFWLISPIFIHLLAKSPLQGWLVSLATIFMSSRVRYNAIYLDEQHSARYDELVQPRADIFMRVSHDLPELYTHPHYRIAAYIVGLLTGHYVYMIKSGKWTSSLIEGCTSEHETLVAATEVSQQTSITGNGKVHERSSEKESGDRQHSGNWRRSVVAYTGLFLFLVMAFVSYLLSHYYPNSYLKHAKLIAALAYSVDHLIMSFGASLIIVAMCFGQWSNFVKFLSHPNWTRLSKMNYAILLLQCEAIYYQIFRYDQVPLAGTRELFNILFNLLVTLYPLSFLVTLAFEYPLANMEKLLI